MNRVLFSSQSDHWSTPHAVFEGLTSEFNFDFDPCPLAADVDGRKIAWSGRVFCNPPYSRIGEFIRRGLHYLTQGQCEVLVFLLPSRTDTGWFHDFCLKADEIRFIRGRLKFGKAKNNAPFPSMIVVFKTWTAEAIDLC